MPDFHAYSPEEIIFDNLRETALRSAHLAESEAAHLAELAAELAEHTDFQELLASLPDALREESVPADDVLPANFRAVREHIRALNVRRRIVLCHALEQRLSASAPLRAEAFFPDAEEVLPDARGRISYQRSGFTDSAYLRFAPLFSDVRAVYAHSFRAACEDVYRGRSEFCILPAENATEGVLVGFARLVDNYRLKITATCDVAEGDGYRFTRYALLRKNPLPIPTTEHAPNRLECVLPLSDPASVADLLFAAEQYGARLLRTDTLPDPDPAKPALIRAAFDLTGADPAALLLYLAMGSNACTILGLYPHLP